MDILIEKFMEVNKQKKIIIITTNPFPIGLAATNRILSYCQGFLHHGFQPEVYCIKPTESCKNVFNNSLKGDYNGIKYFYPGGTTLRVASFLRRRINDIFGILFTLKLLFKKLRKKEIMFVIFYGKNIFAELSCIFLTRIFRKKIFKEESENPNVRFQSDKSAFTKVFKWFYINKLYRYYNGVLVMTQPLRDYFLIKGIPDKGILIVPPDC